MKKLLVLPFLITTIFGLAGCTLINPGNVTVFSNDGNASISVPSGWNTNDMAIRKILPAAVIGASDIANQEYVAVVGEPKSYLGSNSTVNDFFTQIKAGSAAIVANGVWGTPSAITVDGLSGLTARFTGIYRPNKTDSTFFVNLLANNNYYYAVITFTGTALVSTNEATLQRVISSFKAPANTVIRGSWKPYTFPGSVVLFFILLIVGIGLVSLGKRTKSRIRVPHPGKVLKIIMIVTWVILIAAFLSLALINRTSQSSRSSIGPIFPITLACALGTFIYLLYIYRHEGFLAAVGNGFIGAAAGPMVFEFPFDMIVIPQIKASAAFLAAYFGVLDFTVLLTLSLLLLSRRVSITRYFLYALGAMFVVFAVWAWFGFSYPSSPISFALNAISKVLGFVAIAFLFSTESERLPQGGTAKST